jgi:predicted RNase H-like HicB family nuclease/molybdopterin converting factor small subunit
MSRPAIAHAQDPPVARTVRFPAGLREKITADAERCGRSFDGQVIALLRRHYGEDVDIAPNPAEILALAVAASGVSFPREEHTVTAEFTAVFRRVPEGYIAFVEELPGANTQGATLEEARENLQEAVQLVVEANRALAEEELEGIEAIREPLRVSA